MSCQHCESCALAGRSSCTYCGSAVSFGREPTEAEQYETSRAYRDLIIERRVAARTRSEPDVIDQRIITALRTHRKPLDEFTHTDLIPLTNLGATALKHALGRLERKRVVAKVGSVKIRANRFHDLWQLLLQPSDLTPAQPASGAVQGQSRVMEKVGAGSKRAG